MTVTVNKPDLERFINEQVESGRFPSPEAAVEAAIEQMMVDGDAFELTDEQVAEINEADAEVERGEVISLDEAKAVMRDKYGCR